MGEGRGGQGAHQPQTEDYPGHDVGQFEFEVPGGALEAGHRVAVERVADGDVALAGERQDGQHRAVGGPAHA